MDYDQFIDYLNKKGIKEEDYKAKLYFTRLENWKNKYLYVDIKLKQIYKENNDRLYSEEWKKIYKNNIAKLDDEHQVAINRFD